MKNKWNHYGVAAMFTLAVGASLVLAGCGGAKTDTKAAAAVATNLSFNFETGEYSFTGVDKGRTYAIRLYGFDAEGKQEDYYTFTSSNILADDSNANYAGTVDLSADCTPGAKYNAYVMTTTSDYKRGLSDSVTGTYVGVYAAPGAVSEAVQSGETVTVTMDQDVFEAYSELEYPPQTFTLTLYSGADVVQTTKIKLEDLAQEDEEYVDGFGPMAKTGTYHHRSGATAFTGVSDGSYTVTIQADAQEGIYFASVESEATAVTK